MIMLAPIDHLSVEVVPQAIVGRDVQDLFGDRFKAIEDKDDLDAFRGASFKMSAGHRRDIQIAVRHYPGYPEGTSTIYIDREIRDVTEISVLVRQILSEFNLSEHDLKWERADEPGL